MYNVLCIMYYLYIYFYVYIFFEKKLFFLRIKEIMMHKKNIETFILYIPYYIQTILKFY